ncbi:MAG: hypothetical protein IPI49_22950 [Myxococcales bacterium]|nr:hypothetical protein [Myxococcales bacterium]
MTTEVNDTAASGKVPFTAVLFPYIPDSAGDNFASLISYLESNFEQANPEVDLTVVINADLDLYDYSANGTLSKLLGSGPEAAQVVEVDTVLMATLVGNKWVQPVQMTNPGVVATAWEAATLQGVVYGIPTYLCSNVVYAFSSVIKGAANATNLLALLTSIAPNVTPLVGQYKGSWTLPTFYVDAWADTNGATGMAASFELPLNQRTMSFFPTVVNSCVSGGKNPCLDGTYDDQKVASLFANRKANGFIGYTESLFSIRSANPSAPLPTVISDPIGGGTHPTVFVDALVFNPGCTAGCLTIAQAFASYMSSVTVRSTIAFSLDAPAGTLPRYLLQASTAFYSAQPAASDPMYQAYWPIVRSAQAFPNTGFPQSRKDLNAALTAFFAGDTSVVAR